VEDLKLRKNIDRIRKRHILIIEFFASSTVI